MKRSFFQAAIVSILLYGCTTWTLTKRLEKKLDGNYTRMLRAILNKSWQQHPTRRQLYGHLPPITKTIQARRITHELQVVHARQEACPRVVYRWKLWPRRLRGYPENYINQEIIMKQKGREVSQKTASSRSCVCNSPTLPYSIHTYISSNKEKQEKKLITFFTLAFLLFFPVFNNKWWIIFILIL